MDSRSTAKKARGFSLIEVLVVIAIIGVLAGLVNVAIQSSIKRTKVAACAANLKQIGTALEMYVNEYDGYIPPYHFVDGADMRGVKHRGHPELFKLALERFGAVDAQFYCPLDEGARRTADKGHHVVDHTVTSYYPSISIYVFGEKGSRDVRLAPTSLPNPSMTVFLLDDGWSTGNADFDVTPHGESRNNLFFDGHVQERTSHAPICDWPGQNKGCPQS